MKDLLTAEEGSGGGGDRKMPLNRRAELIVKARKVEQRSRSRTVVHAQQNTSLHKKKNTLLKRSDFRLMNEHTNPSNRLEVAGFQLYADTPEALTSR